MGLVVLVDALDEAVQLRGPETIVDLLADVRAYVRRRLAGSPALRARLAHQEVRDSAFVERATTASRGDFLYLVWLLRAIAEGAQR